MILNAYMHAKHIARLCKVKCEEAAFSTNIPTYDLKQWSEITWDQITCLGLTESLVSVVAGLDNVGFVLVIIIKPSCFKESIRGEVNMFLKWHIQKYILNRCHWFIPKLLSWLMVDFRPSFNKLLIKITAIILGDNSSFSLSLFPLKFFLKRTLFSSWLLYFICTPSSAWLLLSHNCGF